MILGTRGSQLALTQSTMVAEALRARGHDVEMRTIKTSGDVITGSLAAQGGVGVFAAALRTALLAGEVDIAVHSFKDLPTQDVPGLVVAGVPPREDPADALCGPAGITLASLPQGARVGTGSPRRAAQLRARRPDLTIVDIRGNVGTRLARAVGPDADLDAVVLAAAGLRRLGLSEAIREELTALLPAPAQGALAIETRDEPALIAAVAALTDEPTRFAACAERAILAELGAGCAAPVAALCTINDGLARLRARIVDAEGNRLVEVDELASTHDDPDVFGRRVARALLARGAASVTALDAARPSRLGDFHDDRALWATDTALIGRRILLPRADGRLAEALREAGADVEAVPLTRTVPVPYALPDAPADWLVLTSTTAVEVLMDTRGSLDGLATRLAVVGASTSAAASEHGLEAALAPIGRSDAQALVDAFPAGHGRVLIAGSALAAPTLPEGLRAKGWQVETVATYTTEPLAAPAEIVQAWERGDYDAVALTSGSIARSVAESLGAPPDKTVVVAFGTPSARAAQRAGLEPAAVAATQDGSGLVAAVVAALVATPEAQPAE